MRLYSECYRPLKAHRVYIKVYANPKFWCFLQKTIQYKHAAYCMAITHWFNSGVVAQLDYIIHITFKVGSDISTFEITHVLLH